MPLTNYSYRFNRNRIPKLQVGTCNHNKTNHNLCERFLGRHEWRLLQFLTL